MNTCSCNPYFDSDSVWADGGQQLVYYHGT